MTSLAEELQYLSLEIEPGVRYSFDDSYIVDPLVIERDPFILAKLSRPVFVTEMTSTVRQYNQMSMTSNPIRVKSQFDDEVIRSDIWKMPDSYKQMTVEALADRLYDRQDELGLSDDRFYVRSARINRELVAYIKDDKLDMLRLMCYIIDTMTEMNQIWGVGRGSSVSSYVLFLIGVHDIDSVKYDLDFTDFMK